LTRRHDPVARGADDYTRSTMARRHGSKQRRGYGGTDGAAGRGRRATGEVREHTARSGVVTYSIRVRWRGERVNVRLGSELEGWNRRLADLKLEETIN